MQLRGKEIIVHHNETFTLDMVVTMRKNAPFIIDENMFVFFEDAFAIHY